VLASFNEKIDTLASLAACVCVRVSECVDASLRADRDTSAFGSVCVCV